MGGSGLEANLPGAHRYIPGLALTAATIGAMKLLRSRPAKQMVSAPWTSYNVKKLYKGTGVSFSQKGMSRSRSTSSRRKVALALPTPQTRGRSATRRGSGVRSMSGISALRRAMSFSRSTRRSRGRHHGVSKSGSFIRRPKSIRSYRKRFKITQKGVSKVVEYGGTTAAADVIYLGHCTCPQYQMRWMICAAMVKSMALKMGHMFRNFEDTIDYSKTGDLWKLWYNSKYDNVAEASFTYTAAADNYTWRTVVDYYTNNITIDNDQLNFSRFEFIPNITTTILHFTQINLFGATIGFNVKSSLKFQNRSIPGTDEDDMENVANVPVYGKSYQGYGTGTQYVGGTGGVKPFVCDAEYGVMDKAGVNQAELEPPIPQMFSNVKRSGKIHLDAGNMQTSKLTWKKRMPLATVLVSLFGDKSVDGSYPTYKVKNIGLFRFMAFEKMIDTAFSDPDITIGYEHNLDMYVAFNNGRMNTTTKEYKKAFKS